MTTYRTGRCRPINADSAREAAEVFAGRLARRAYGRRGYARTLNCTAWSQDNTITEWQAFIGYRSGPSETTGSNEYFTIHSEPATTMATITLHDYRTGEPMRLATKQEEAASIAAAQHDGGHGVIEVDGRLCYVI